VALRNFDRDQGTEFAKPAFWGQTQSVLARLL
jgi:hypothetical protein